MRSFRQRVTLRLRSSARLIPHFGTLILTIGILTAALLLLPVMALAQAGGSGSGGPADFRWTAPKGLGTLDPHAVSDIGSLGVLGSVYEGLVRRGPDLALEPGLALDWTPLTNTRWRFTLRTGVRFHDGSTLDAGDVETSIMRARRMGGMVGDLVADVIRVRDRGTGQFDIVTRDPVPDLPYRLADIAILDTTWLKARKDSDLTGVANGTGPFRVTSFTANGPLAMAAFRDWWDRPQHNLATAVLYPAADAATRLRFLVENRVDLAVDLPPDAMPVLRTRDWVAPIVTPSARTLVLGMDQTSDFLRDGQARGNPFRDQRVREAVFRAIDMTALENTLLDGLGTPSALIAAPALRGFPSALNTRPASDPDRARRLLAEAGYDNGFAVDLDCPSGHYQADAALCRAIGGMLGAVGIRVSVQLMEPAAYFKRVLMRESSFFLLGWLPNTLEITNPVANLAVCPDDTTPGTAPPPGRGALNLGGWCNIEADRLYSRMSFTMNDPQRWALAAQVLQMARDSWAYVPLHQEPLIWGRRAEVYVRPRADDVLSLRHVFVER